MMLTAQARASCQHLKGVGRSLNALRCTTRAHVRDPLLHMSLPMSPSSRGAST